MDYPEDKKILFDKIMEIVPHEFLPHEEIFHELMNPDTELMDIALSLDMTNEECLKESGKKMWDFRFIDFAKGIIFKSKVEKLKNLREYKEKKRN